MWNRRLPLGQGLDSEDKAGARHPEGHRVRVMTVNARYGMCVTHGVEFGIEVLVRVLVALFEACDGIDKDLLVFSDEGLSTSERGFDFLNNVLQHFLVNDE